eukprot:gb/GFBE01045926.1/.p1 GENE.gb/GFBE01045926.1/~~gb/GFBE01045926.1/.p1  ORF type:complete len:541 (+),score=110.19 gb/GFBE01045926.1/:1-1623(+)
MLVILGSLLVAPRALAASASCSRDHVLLQRGGSLARGAQLEKASASSTFPKLNAEGPETIFFDAIIRDFTADHPDFQSFDGHSEGLVESKLGADKKPVYKGGPQLSNKENFDQWFRDVPGVNKRLDFKMDFNKTAQEGTYVHEDDEFFPIDGRGWGDSNVSLQNELHNFYFTLELHTTFVYQGGEKFTFRGDDDVWVFMNDNLVIDLGGVHDPMARTFDIDGLNLSAGSAVELDFFFAERRCCGSEFRIETSITPVKGTCTIWGDPHIDVFDNGLFGRDKLEPLGIYTSGDYWLVKSEVVQMQARYGTTIFTPSGQSALLKLAVSGPFLQNHTLIIEPMDDGGVVTWDGEPILTEMPSEFVQPFTRIRFMEGEKHIDDVLKGYPVKLIQAYFTRNVVLTVNRWPKHIDAIIQMPQQLGGQDGHCGNFDFNVSDDTKELILARVGAAVPAEESLFPPSSEAEIEALRISAHNHREMSLADCTPEVKKLARQHCRQAMVAEGGSSKSHHLLRACMFDYCFAGKEFAAESAIVQHEMGEAEGV